MTTKDLKGKTSKELVGIHNGLNPAHPLKQWKQNKDLLINRIEALSRQVVKKAPKTVLTKAKAKVPQKTTVTKPAGEIKTEATGKPATRTIRAAAIELLCLVDFFEDRDEKLGADNVIDEKHEHARSVGIAYDEIIRRIKAEFSSCKTTVACLRWYSVKIRVEEFGYENLRLPQRRPRAKAKAKV